MLLLPPGMVAEKFDGVMGFTLTGQSTKSFEVTVQRGPNVDEDRFPVRLMVEYGEMLKHYSREIKGFIQFSPSWYSVKYLKHFTVLVIMGFILALLYFRFYYALKKGSNNG